MNLKALADLIGTMPGYDAQTPTADIVVWLKETQTVVVPERMVNARTVLSELPGGPLVAAGVLDKLETAAANVSAVKWVLSFLKADGGIDIADQATRAAIDALVGGGMLTAEEGSALKALGEKTVTRWSTVGGNDTATDGSRYDSVCAALGREYK
jgi:hypothetical protein